MSKEPKELNGQNGSKETNEVKVKKEKAEAVNESIREKNRQATAQAWKNMNAALNDRDEYEGINAVLKFFNEKGRVGSGITMAEQLKIIEDQFFIRTRYVELDEDWYRTAAVPMLVKTKDDRWLAVIPVTDGTCFCMDRGAKVKVTRKKAAEFTDSAICFYRGMKNGRLSLKELISFLFRCSSKRDRITVLAASVLATLAGMLLPWVNSFIFSDIIPAGEKSGIAAAAALLFAAVLTAAVLGLLQSLVLTNTVLRCGVYVQSAIFSRLLTLKTDFFKSRRSGELSRMVTEFSDISQILSVRSISACISLVLSFFYLIQIYIYAPRLFVWILLSTALLGAVMTAEGILHAGWMRRYSQSLSKMSGFCYEMLAGMEHIKLNGAEARIMRRWSERYLDASRNEDKPFFLKYAQVFYKLVSIFTTAVIFLSGAGMAASDYIAFSAAYGAYTAAGAGATVIIQTIASLKASYSLISPVLEAECEEYGSEKKTPERLRGEITVSDLYFRYADGAPYVLQGLSVHIREGESVGVIGTSGCGKSTLIRLLLGFEEAEKGSVYIDEFDIRELDMRSCRRKIGTVLQDAGIISGDIYSNITITKPDANREEVREAIDMAGLTETIESLPMGVHTPISQENCTLSGGQRQRVLIARALITKPSILIFDEATSALDNITQAKISESVNRLKCTKIIVAHRLSTIQQCDRILVMDKGGIVQEGTFEELKNADGLLKQLLVRQEIR